MKKYCPNCSKHTDAQGDPLAGRPSWAASRPRTTAVPSGAAVVVLRPTSGQAGRPVQRCAAGRRPLASRRRSTGGRRVHEEARRGTTRRPGGDRHRCRAAGIGRATALRLARDGAAVVVNDIDAEPAAETVALDRGRGRPGAAPRRQHRRPRRRPTACAKAAVDAFGKLDILVNNAGHHPRQDVPRHDRRAVRLRPRRQPQDGLPHDAGGDAVHARGGQGRDRRDRAQPAYHRKIVFTSSVAALMGNPGQVNYTAAKGALIAVTKTLARELGPFGINVNAVAPGLHRDPAHPGQERRRRSTASPSRCGRCRSCSSCARPARRARGHRQRPRVPGLAATPTSSPASRSPSPAASSEGCEPWRSTRTTSARSTRRPGLRGRPREDPRVRDRHRRHEPGLPRRGTPRRRSATATSSRRRRSRSSSSMRASADRDVRPRPRARLQPGGARRAAIRLRPPGHRRRRARRRHAPSRTSGSAAGNDILTTRSDISTVDGEPVVTAWAVTVARGTAEESA